jgi:hypothetical protein
MRSTKRCPKCRGGRVGKLPWLLHGDHSAHRLEYRLLPLGVRGTDPLRTDGLSKEQLDSRGRLPREVPGLYGYAVGRVEAYICTECGYSELYVCDPSTIDFEELTGFEWLRPDEGGPGPYR